MANLEINTQLFDGLSLHQRIQAVIEIEAATIKARELRTDIEDLVVSTGPTNGQYIARYVIEDAMRKVQRHLIDSTVEKFGGGE